jgi:PKD repeat protein
MRHLDSFKKRVKFFTKQRQKTLVLVAGTLLMIFYGFVAESFSMLPPLRDVQITSQTSGGNINYKFKVFDEQRNQWIEGETGFWQSSLITTPASTDGVVRWVVGISTNPVSNRVYYSVYDPKLGSWQTNYKTVASVSTSNIKSKNGMLLFVSTSSAGGDVFVVAYDAGLGVWKDTSYSFPLSSFQGFGTSEVGDGVAAWTTFYTLSPNFSEITVHTLAYNGFQQSWQKDSTSHSGTNQILTLSPIANSTVYYTLNGTAYTRGYDPECVSFCSFWFNGTTIPLAYFVPSQTTGNVPLKIYFWDMSLGGSSWSYNFGDGGTSTSQSPFYTYNSAAGTPYTATQTVSGPGGTKSRSVTITPTTPHSISGNVANVNGFKISNATVTLTGTLSRTTQTDSNGNYSFTNLTANGNYTVTISKSGYTYTPPTRTFTNLTGSQTGNFIGKLNDKSSDFDGDGKTDASVFRPSVTTWYILNSSNGSSTGNSFGAATDKITPRDFDGDGKTDIAVWRPSDGGWYILRSSNGTFLGISFGASGDIPVANDYDGDDKADAAVFRPSDQTWYILKSSNSQLMASVFGASTDKPVSGDFDGDEKADVAVWRPSDATWYVLKSSDGGLLAGQFGQSSDNPTQSDFDGDGKTDFATYRPSDGNWRIKRSSDGVTVTQSWGATTDKLVPGDYDGDGKSDIAVFRPSDGTWYVSKSSDQTLLTINYGANGDYPTPNSYIPE